MIISSWENSEENVIFLPCFSTEFARFYLTGNKQKIARRTVYFSTSVRPVMFRLWHDHCTSPTLSRKLHLFFYRTHKVLDDTLLSRIKLSTFADSRDCSNSQVKTEFGCFRGFFNSGTKSRLECMFLLDIWWELVPSLLHGNDIPNLELFQQQYSRYFLH